MPKRERDEALSELSSRIFSTMIEEMLLDVALQSFQEIARSRAMCNICHTRCGSVHATGSSSFNLHSAASSATVSTPPDGGRAAESNGTGSHTPMNGKADGNVYYECTNCKRQIASNRYAPHLGSCMGLGNSRRGAARNAATRNKLASEAGRSASPYIGSENGNFSDDSKTATKGKGKSKAKRTDDAEFSLNRKRPGSPSLSPAKKTKKQKTGSAAGRRADSDVPGSPNNLPPGSAGSRSGIPSRLRDSSIVSSAPYDRRSSSPESRDSSPDRSVSTPVSAPSIKSPPLASAKVPAKGKGKNGKQAANAAPVKRPSPPRLPAPVIRMPEPDYLVDVEGEETGSSTDTDSS